MHSSTSTKRPQIDEKIAMRRLRPLYDLVDAGQNKKAISEADKMLKKHPKLHTASALKALALIRVERFNDADALIASLEDICRSDEIDESFVQALSHCYKELNRPDRVVDMYTELTRRQPTNEAFMRELFFAFARCINLKEQQRVALQLAKICTVTEPATYVMWAVLVILVQGFADKQLGASMLFQLANRMLEKVKDDELVQHQGGLELRLTALEAIGKYAEAIALIRVHFDQSAMNMRTLQRLRRLHQLGENHAELFRLCMDQVDNDHTDWTNWTHLIDSFLRLRGSEDSGSFLSALIEKFNFLSTKCDERVDLFGRRTLLLAKLLTIERLSSSSAEPLSITQMQLVEQKFGSPFVLHKEVVRTFHDRPSTFMDLKMFLHLLTIDEQRTLLQYISTLSTNDNDVDCCAPSSSSSSSHYAVSVSSVCWTFLLAEMVSFHCFPPSTVSDECLKDSIRRLLDKLSQMDNSDMAIAVLAQLVSKYCWEFFLRTGNYNLLLILLSFLEMLLTRQPQCNALIPILLCRIYALFGNATRIDELVTKQMDVKFVQRINLAFLQCFVAENFGHFKRAANYYSAIVNLDKSNAREISECIVAAFRKEKYLQVANLYDFLNACHNSVYVQCAVVQNALFAGCFASQSLEMASNCLAMEDDSDFDLDRIVDNREFSTVKLFLTDTTQRELREGTLDEIKAYLRLRSALGIAISSIGKQTLERNAAEFFATLELCRKAFATAPNTRNLLENFTDTGLELLLCGGANSGDGGESASIIQLPVAVLNAAMAAMKTMALPRASSTMAANSIDLPKNDDDGQQQRLTETAAQQFATLLDGILLAVDNDHRQQQSADVDPPIVLTLKQRIVAVRKVAKLIEMVAFALVGAKRLERLFPSSSSTSATKGSGDGGAKKERSGKQQQQRKSADKLGPFSRPIHQALQRLRAFVTAKLNRPEKTLSAQQVDQQDQFDIREMFPECMKAELAVAERKILRENATAFDLSCKEIDETIDHLIQFCCH